MPELPEVETVRRSLEQIVGLTVEGVKVSLPKLLQNISVEAFAQGIVARTITSIDRRGKYLLFRLSGGYTLVVHLRMTGQLRYSSPEDAQVAHTHIVLTLSDGKELRYTDIRQFGYWFFADDTSILKVSRMEALGPEPLDESFTVEVFASKLAGRRGKIKAALLDQKIVAGIGNIYADEGLFLAGIHPARTVDSLSPDDISRLHEAIRHVLSRGVQLRGTTFSDYVDGMGLSGEFQYELKVYGRKGEQCLSCDALIERLIVVGRGTHICPRCQS